ncbi:MAG: iron-containing alcohol dehydrogenase [Chloroflexi bacterium]|nr:iron-containing alcohol dehydrogenase [Chloroflexota bacterium]
MTRQRSFRHLSSPVRLYFGEDSLRRLPGELERLDCKRAVVFCGQTVANKTNALQLVREALGERYAGVFDGVEAHSPLPSVLAGVDVLRSAEADAVVAIGGGSAIVSARASTILLAENKDAHELCTQYPPGKAPVSPRLNKPKLPQFVVPTTPTTAYAKAGTAIVDPALGRRLAMFDPKTRPVAIFIHPEVSLTAPTSLALSSALNSFSLAIQGLESKSHQPLADALLLHGLRLTCQFTPKMLAYPNDDDARGQLMLGALLVGQGTDFSPGALASAVAHSIGARFHADNGTTGMIILPHAMRFNAPAVEGRHTLVAEALGSEVTTSDDPGGTETAIAAVMDFVKRAGIPGRLRDIGVSEDALPQLAEDSAGDWFLHQNPRPITESSQLLEILRAAW